MNRARVAALLRELADEIEDDDADVVDKPRANSRRPRGLTRPARKVSDLAAAKAARALKERGFT